MPISNRDLLEVLKDTAEFLEASEVAQTSVGIQAYCQAKILNRKIVELEQDIAEEDAYIDMLAERMGYA